jgi:hypothetical protein
MPELMALFHYKRIVETYSGEKSGLANDEKYIDSSLRTRSGPQKKRVGGRRRALRSE